MIPSLLQIPSAVSDSKLHSVLPNNGKGDFTFDRSTGATRINKDGLIEEVGYFSSELVQNGNFSELGSEQIVNSTFNTNSFWEVANATADNYVEFINGQARLKFLNTSPITQLIAQGFTYQSGKTYKLVVDVASVTSGSIKIDANGISETFNTAGVNTRYITPTGNGNIAFYRASSNVDITLNSVSVKQVDPNDRWTLASNWSYGTNKITSDGSQTGNVSLTQANSIMGTVTGKVYQVKFTISDYSAGTINAHIQGQGSTNVTGNGEKKVIVTASSASYGINMYADSSFAGSVSNISVVEVQGDRPRLSYDITNGVVEDKPHLLLEPSSTNLVTFSEDFSQWVNVRTTDSLSTISSPQNTTNVYKIIPTTDNATHRIDKVITLTDTNTYSLSFFAKKGEYNCIRAAIGNTSVAGNTVSFNLNTGVKTEAGTVAGSSMTLLPNGWYRCSLTTTAGTSDRVVIGIGNNDTYSFAGDGTSGLYLWGAMIEEKAFSTSYIKTAGTTITRAAETSYIHNIDDGVLNQSNFTLFLDTNVFNDTANNFLELIILYNDSNPSTTNLRFESRTNGQVYVQHQGCVNSGDNFNSATFGSNSVNFKKFAISCSTSEVKIYADGNEINDYTGSYVFNFQKIGFRNNDGTVETILKHKGVAIYNGALTDAQLIQLTS